MYKLGIIKKRKYSMTKPFGQTTATISKRAEQSLHAGHPWVYDTEVMRIDGEYKNGDIITLVNLRGVILGKGFINDCSKIRLRVLAHGTETVDEAFFKRRLQNAWDYRKAVMGKDISCCRIVFGEADFLPGLTIDRFENILVAQTLSLGTERHKGMLFAALREIMARDGAAIDGVFERNDVAIRGREGMEEGKGFYPLAAVAEPAATTVTIRENGILYDVDIENGQKTGFFLDQKYNRLAIQRLAPGRRVLDCFTHTGSFALNAAFAGAERVTAVDISAEAVEMARRNAIKNGLEGRMEFTAANVFDLLPTLVNGAERLYDLIILDPPAFTKSRKTAANAMRGYKEINLRAMKLLAGGGILATCSCSHFLTDDLFRGMLGEAASDAGVQLRQIEARAQSPDHPVLWNVPETAYLKFYTFQVL